MMLSRQEFKKLFDDDWSSAWRWERQGVYHEPDEEEPLRRFLAGEPEDLSWFMFWPDRVRSWVASGRKIGRVRMLTDPLTDYLRFELSITPPAVEAGEDIRFMTQAQAADLGAPGEDYWMFDDQRVALMTFGDHGVNGAQLITGEENVRKYVAWKDVAVREATPHALLT